MTCASQPLPHKGDRGERGEERDDGEAFSTYTCLVSRGLEACLATTSATIRVTAGATFLRHSPPSAHCTSTSQGTTKLTPSHHPMRSWWTPPSRPAATHPRAPMPTSTMPTTLPWVASPILLATPARSALWRAMGLPCPLLSGYRRQPGSSALRGKQEGRPGQKGSHTLPRQHQERWTYSLCSDKPSVWGPCSVPSLQGHNREVFNMIPGTCQLGRAIS